MHNYYISDGVDVDKVRAEAALKQKDEDVTIHFHPYDEGACKGWPVDDTENSKAHHEIRYKGGI